MSKIALTPSATGTGVFTISSPATSTDRTLTLPDEAGTVLTSVSSLASANLTGTVASGRMPAGSVLQVVSFGTHTSTATTSTSFVTTAFSITITPSSSASKILILHNGMVNVLGTSSWGFYTLYRGATNLYASGAQGIAGGVYVNGATDSHAPSSIAYLDSPATTSAVTYAIYVKSGNGTNMRYNADSWFGTINALEIAG